MPKTSVPSHNTEEYQYPHNFAPFTPFVYPLPRINITQSPPPSPSKHPQVDPEITDHDTFLNFTFAANSVRARSLTLANAKVAKASKRRLAAKLLS